MLPRIPTVLVLLALTSLPCSLPAEQTDSDPCQGLKPPGSTKRCVLIAKLRSDEYTRIQRATISNSELFDYLEGPANLAALQTLVAQLDYGREVDNLTRSSDNACQVMLGADQFYKLLNQSNNGFLDLAPVLLAVLEAVEIAAGIQQVIYIYREVVAGAIIIRAYRCFKIIRELKITLRYYFQRRSGQLPTDAWSDLKSSGHKLIDWASIRAGLGVGLPECLEDPDVGGCIEQVVLAEPARDPLHAWYESAYIASRWWTDEAKRIGLRHEEGEVIACVARMWLVGVRADLERRCSSREDKMAVLAGRWSGEVTQFSYGSYPATMTIWPFTEVEVVGTVDYPTLDCGGTISRSQRTRSTEILSETINYGRDRCVDGGTIHLRIIDGNTLSWEWFFPNGSKGASATMTRVVIEETGQPEGAPGEGAGSCLLKSLIADEEVILVFMNTSQRTVVINWLDYEGMEKRYTELRPGQTWKVKTFMTHPWCVRDKSSGEIVRSFVVTAEGPRLVVIPSSGRGSAADSITGGSSGTWTQVVAGDRHTCGLRSDGALYCWGTNYSGQLGNGTTVDSHSPVAVSGGHDFVSVTAGAGHTCGVTTSGRAYCWGSNPQGALGDGSTKRTSTPTAVLGQLSLISISAGLVQTCGVSTTGFAYCWGNNNNAQLGTGRHIATSAVPVRLTDTLMFRTVVAQGSAHSCGILTNHAAFCWGQNLFGQLGDGAAGGWYLPTRDTPFPVAGNLRFAALTTGKYHTCGVTRDRKTYCWGSDGDGQLGDGAVTPFSGRNAPGLVIGNSFEAVSAGGMHTCGLTGAGAAYCWGRAISGQLGNGQSGAMLRNETPVAVSGGLTFLSITAGWEHTCGIAVDGRLYCWGRNWGGRLGDGTATDRNTPTLVATSP